MSDTPENKPGQKTGENGKTGETGAPMSEQELLDHELDQSMHASDPPASTQPHPKGEDA